MKNPDRCRIHGQKTRSLVFFCVLTLLVVFGSGIVAMASGGGEHGEATKGWLATDTYRVMNFVLLAAVLFLLLRKPVSKAFGDRIQGIKEQLADLENKKAEAEKRLAEYNEKLSDLEKETESIVTEFVRQGEEAKKRIISEAEASAVKLEEQAKRNIEHEFKQAKSKLQADIMEKAMVKAENLIREKISTEDQDRLVDEYLDKVVA